VSATWKEQGRGGPPRRKGLVFVPVSHGRRRDLCGFVDVRLRWDHGVAEDVAETSVRSAPGTADGPQTTEGSASLYRKIVSPA
jgi:hypothetical protein